MEAFMKLNLAHFILPGWGFSDALPDRKVLEIFAGRGVGKLRYLKDGGQQEPDSWLTSFPEKVQGLFYWE